MTPDLWTALLAVTWVIGWLLFFRLPSLPAAGPARERRVSVVIPARDEAAALPHLLAALDRQTTPAAEVVVVDDHSADDTGAVAFTAGAQVLPSPPLPEGWTGKASACWYGAHQTTGDVLVFLDADTEPAPGLLVRLVAELERRRGLVSVAPYHRMARAYERLSALFHAIAVMGIGAASARPGASVTGAFGPCLACTRADYTRIGGHEVVRSAVADDIALARVFRDAGLPVHVVAGREAIRYRLYPNGVRQLADGWSKNFAAGAGSTPIVRFLLVMAWVIGLGTAAQVPFRAALTALADWSYPGLLGWVAYAAFAAQLGIMLRPLGNYSWAAPLFPVPLAAWFVIFFRSIVWMVRGTVRWKGRVVPVRP
ncbi:MAG TPA: glycosyltransferase family 2 protein [Acidimicrobiia bacterium]|nr:glycosyltransferase family 2 protein [Acidimicrobiia bacterium]